MNGSFLHGSVKKRYVLVGIILLFTTIGFIFLLPKSGIKEQDNILLKRISELQLKMQYLSSLYELRDQDVYLLSEKVSQVITSSQFTEDTEPFISLKNLSNEDVNMFGKTVRAPTIYNFLPHLLLNPSASLRPAYCYSKGRVEVSFVMGIPTVKRPTQSYLISTLNDLLQKMTPEEKNDTLIVVFIAEVDDYVLHVANEIKKEFKDYLESGLLEIISPPQSYYPDFENLQITFGDSYERVRWRSKQNLDFAFLMMYAYSKGMFYVQLEDDVLAKRNFLSKMKEIAFEKSISKENWFVLDFCQLGFIGKMFRSADLPRLIQFFLMFYNDKPVDWLLDGLIQTKVCNIEKDYKDCRKRKNELWVHIKPSLFQHIGTTSSLKGKIQKLKDKHFGKVSLFTPHKNPSAEVRSSIKPYLRYILQRAYRGESFFWGLTPQIGDWMSFKFLKPIKIKRFRFRTGNAEHPSDKLSNATVQALLSVNLPNKKSSHLVNDTYVSPYISIGSFNNLGIAESNVDLNLGPIKELRIVILKNAENWVILSEHDGVVLFNGVVTPISYLMWKPDVDVRNIGIYLSNLKADSMEIDDLIIC